MDCVAGVDGCRGGWVVVLREVGSARLRLHVVQRVEEILALPDSPKVVCIDVPIGLLDSAQPSGRACDKAARSLLGQPRARSVFSPPARPVLAATTYPDALARSRASSPHSLGLSRQCWGIVPKIIEVDRFITPQLQECVIEVHPEVSFCAMNGGRPLISRKKDKQGVEERLALLERAWGKSARELLNAPRDRSAKKDDVLDAMAACWTAERVLHGTAESLPLEPVRDARGLRMEIVR